MRKKFIVMFFFLGLLGMLGFRLYQETVADSPGPGAAGGGFAGAGGRGGANLLVETGVIELHSFGGGREFVGELNPLREVEVIPRASGYIRNIVVENADVVVRDQLLAEIDNAEIEQQMRRQEAALAVARAGAAREAATLENLRLQVERNRSLYEEGLVALQAVEDIESRYRVGEAQLQLAHSQVDQAEASLEELRIQHERNRVYAPMDGIVVDRQLDPGALVGQNTPILTLIDLSRLKTVVAAPEAAIPDLRTGVEAEVIVDALPDRVYRGRIVRLSPRVNPETRSVEVEIQIEDPDRVLRPGMFARVRVGGAASAPRPSIPRAALLTRGATQGVYLLEDGDVVRFRAIRMGRNEGGWVEVLDGLQPGEVFVTSGAQSLNEGDRVRLAQSGAAGAGGRGGAAGGPGGAGSAPEGAGELAAAGARERGEP